MPRLGVYFRAELENLERVELAANTRWCLQTKCSNCGEEHGDVWCQQGETQEVDGSRGEAHVVMKCAMCERQNTIVMEEQPEMVYSAERHGGEPALFAVFDCRGVDVVGWKPTEGLTAAAAGSSKTFDVALEDGEFYDFDDEADVPVSVTGVEVTVGNEGGGKKKKKGKK